MPYQELDGLGMAGLNQDTPSQALDHLPFSAGFNMRPFDGSLQQVYAFTDDLNDNIAPNDDDGNGDNPRSIFGATQWTPSGSNTLNIAYAYEFDIDSRDLSIQIVENILNEDDNMVPGVVATTKTIGTSRFDLDIFAFNDVVIINDGFNHPVWLTQSDGYAARLLPGWPAPQTTAIERGNDYFIVGDPSIIQPIIWLGLIYDLDNFSAFTIGNDYIEGHITLFESVLYRCISSLTSAQLTPPNDTASWEVFDATPIQGQRVTIADTASDSVLLLVNNSETNLALFRQPISAERFVPFNNRLVALNISEEFLDDESYGNTTLLWSSSITELGSLVGMEWAAAATNTAGDDIVTETSGELLDAVVLGQYLIVYKTDGVFRYTDIGAPLYLIGEALFTDDGLYSPNCAVDIGGGRHFVMGNYGVYIHDGGPNKQNVSRGRVERYMYSNIHQYRRDDTFVFHHTSDKEVWICFPGPYLNEAESVDQDPNFAGPIDTGCNRALVYNYENDTWYERELPVYHDIRRVIVDGEDIDDHAHGLLGITATEQDGGLYIFGFFRDGTRFLRNERSNDVIETSGQHDFGDVDITARDYLYPGFVEFHYMDMGDQSKVKYVRALYPHTMENCKVEILATNDLGSSSDPNFIGYVGTPVFASDDQYKLDTRVHGRYIHMALHSDQGGIGLDDDENTNPMITGMGIQARIGGDR